MTDSDRTAALLQELRIAGWDPNAPSEECTAAIRRPDMPGDLGDADARGVHWLLLQVILLSRFARGKPDAEREALLRKAAVAFVLASEGVPMEPDRLLAMQGQLTEWESDRFWPAQRAMGDGLAAGPREWSEFRRRFDPAATFLELSVQLRLVDVEGDQRKAALAVQMWSQGTHTPDELDGPLHLDHLLDLFDKCFDQARVSTFGRDGKLRLHAGHAKDALERSFGRSREAQPACQPTKSLDPQETDLPDGSEPGAILQALEASDAAERVGGYAASELKRSTPGSSRSHVLSNLVPLLSGELSLEALAREVGLTKQTLHEDLQEVRRRVQEKFFRESP